MSKIHVLWTETAFYLPRVRYPGCRNYKLLPRRKTLKSAMSCLALAMASGMYKRGDVLGCPPIGSYYGPHPLFEIVKS